MPEFQKISVFSKFDSKILAFITDIFKKCRFCGQWLRDVISICSKWAKWQNSKNPQRLLGVFLFYIA
ncbi:TPA: hypothetical protein U1372_001872 [Streptococcus suis]|nr:hypothetical protein [Streptococcus suis]